MLTLYVLQDKKRYNVFLNGKTEYSYMYSFSNIKIIYISHYINFTKKNALQIMMNL